MNSHLTASEKDLASVMKDESDSRINWLTGWRVYALTIAVYLLAMLGTDAFFMGDANDYVESVIAYRRGYNLHFWEFGHLLWRPFGWLMAEVLHPVTSRIVGPYPRANVMLALVWLNLAAGILSVVCLVRLLSRYCRNGSVISLAATGFILSQGVLNFSQTGSSYIPGLASLMLGLCFMTAPAETKRRFWLNSIAAGLAFALSVCFWFLFVWALPAAILLPLILHEASRQRVKFTIASVISFSAFTSAFYLFALAVLRIADFAGLKAWILDSGHGIKDKGLARLVLGIARSFINMGNDGMLVKRFLLGDPYNSVTAWQLTMLSLWKLALFYVFMLAIFWMLWKCEKRARFFLLIAATIPIFVFAFFFAPGAIERYLAWYPFCFLMVAYAVEKTSLPNRIKIVPVIFLTALAVVNIQAMFQPFLSRQQERIVARLGDLPAKLPPKSELLAVNWQDEMVNFYRSFPFHPLNQRESFVITSLVTPGVEDSKYWRQDFAKRAIRIWSAGGELWLSNRAFSQRPAADWNWVEGDDENVSWKEFPEFFANLKLGETSGGVDGFHQVPPSEENKKFLQALIASDDRTSNQAHK